ncbi:MAG: hypothetical protein NTZ77_06920 [Caldiserica bacterium]|nr:hypothetical protein [Caldisericota bacterium]
MDISKREEAVAYLVQKATYPMWSKAGTWFRDADGGRVEKPQGNAIVQALDLVTKEACTAVRKEVRSRVNAERTYVPIREWAIDERPREQLAKRGADTMSNARLLAILFRTGSHGKSAEELGRDVFNRFGGWSQLDQASVEDLCDVRGIGLAKAVELKAAIDNKVIKDAEVSRGSISASVVDPADIVREACIHHASRVVLVHNHPSGECDPSKEDIDTTNKITQALKYVGVRVLDHIIVGRARQDYFSFARAGMV